MFALFGVSLFQGCYWHCLPPDNSTKYSTLFSPAGRMLGSQDGGWGGFDVDDDVKEFAGGLLNTSGVFDWADVESGVDAQWEAMGAAGCAMHNGTWAVRYVHFDNIKGSILAMTSIATLSGPCQAGGGGWGGHGGCGSRSETVVVVLKTSPLVA